MGRVLGRPSLWGAIAVALLVCTSAAACDPGPSYGDIAIVAKTDGDVYFVINTCFPVAGASVKAKGSDGVKANYELTPDDAIAGVVKIPTRNPLGQFSVDGDTPPSEVVAPIELTLTFDYGNGDTGFGGDRTFEEIPKNGRALVYKPGSSVADEVPESKVADSLSANCSSGDE